ncbi:MAG: (2Fe-2S)-binding protein [Deltaproteobacteria bacterium]|jgi:carbon-monoxide dehydrogenase small subunit|nr:(2Fe-2S)-binding protein [Deltaproteobacteria bacterium]MBW2536984.1 (2Fe-2S)-binding protein [Deltaproteobacteria bacterium]
MAKQGIELIVNSDRYEVWVDPRRSLAEALREDLGLTGTKIGCNQGDCGACTVLLDGRPVCSCLTLAVEADGRETTTIEGVADSPEQLHAVQRAFVQRGAIQCGYCTPGMIMTSVHLLATHPQPDAETIRCGLAGNLCRCTGYYKIVDAVRAAAVELGEGGAAAEEGRP